MIAISVFMFAIGYLLLWSFFKQEPAMGQVQKLFGRA